MSLRAVAAVVFVLGGCVGSLDAPVEPRPTHELPDGGPSVVLDADASGSISGRVRHGRTGVPLRNALVVLQPERSRLLEIMTDDLGRFRFEGLPPSTYRVQVFVGHAEVVETVALEEMATHHADFRVDPTGGRSV